MYVFTSAKYRNISTILEQNPFAAILRTCGKPSTRFEPKRLAKHAKMTYFLLYYARQSMHNQVSL